jgi:hypothetical protein
MRVQEKLERKGFNERDRIVRRLSSQSMEAGGEGSKQSRAGYGESKRREKVDNRDVRRYGR